MAVSKNTGKEDVQDSQKVEEKVTDHFLLYLTSQSDSMNTADTLAIQTELQKVKIAEGKNRIHLVLHTTGGNPYTAATIVNMLHKKFDFVTVVVPFWAKSAGTLIAIGGNELVMSDLSQLGPLDMQIKHPNKEKSISALDITNPTSYIVGVVASASSQFYKKIRLDSGNTISVKESMKIAYDNSVKLFHPIVSQLDPTDLSRCNRVLDVAEKYGTEFLEKYSLKNTSEKYRNLLISYLIYGFPDHGFAIFGDDLKGYGFNVTLHQDYPFWNDIWEVVSDDIEKDINTGNGKKLIKLLTLK